MKESSFLNSQSSDSHSDRLIERVKKRHVISVPNIPLFHIPRNSTLFISNNDVTYSSHGIHEFPAKFIPQVPSWVMKKYCRTVGEDWVLDPFCGCGTTLIEAKILGFNSYGVDIDPMGKLLTSVKTTVLEKEILNHTRERILSDIQKESASKLLLPEFPNRRYWFSDEASEGIGLVKATIDGTCNDVSIRNFFYVCLSAIIREVSYADSDQIFPERTTWGTRKKIYVNKEAVFERFRRSVDKYIPKIVDFSQRCHHNVVARLVEKDAKDIRLEDGIVDVAVTSPPYINAIDYSRVNQLEMFWLDLLDKTRRIDLKKKYIGTEAVSSKLYSKLNLFDGEKYSVLNHIIKTIYGKDRLRAFVVYQFFKDMKRNFEEVYRILKPSFKEKRGRYIVISGDGVIRKTPIPTHRILCKIGEDVGFKIDNIFSYVIRRRTLLITRAKHSGIIKKDWVTIFRKD